MKRFFLFLLLPASLHAASVLDIGTDYRLRGVSLSQTDFGATSDQDFSFYSQRAKAHIGGRFSPNIEMMVRFQAISVVGSSDPVTYPSAAPGASRLPNTDFTPWVQNAYFKVGRLYDWPVTITVGRQPMMMGDGLILSDDELGFTGIRLQGQLPFYGLQGDVFTFKAGDSVKGSADKDIHGVEITKPFRNVRIQASWLMERDATGSTIYIRPSENRWDPRFDGGTDFRASRITRNFYDLRLEGRLLEGGFYKTELALQGGKVDRSSATLGSVDLGGYAFLISGGLYTRFSKYGPIEIHGLFGMASGDSGAAKDSSFRPSYGRKFDGLERSGFGEFYGASLYDALPSAAYSGSASSPTVSGLPPGYSGIRVYGAGVTAHPTALISIGIDYYVFDAQESPGSNFALTSSESSLGSEIDFGIGFAYTNYLSFRGSAAFFSPGKAYATRDKAHRYLVEAVGRF